MGMISFSALQSDKNSLRDVIWMLCAAGFVLPVTVGNVLLAMVVLSNMLTGSWHLFTQRIKQPVFWLPVLFFAWCMASVMWSSNGTEGWHYVERKLAFLVLPVSFAFVTSVNRNTLHNVAKAYVWSVSLALLYCVQRAWVLYRYTGDRDYFFYHRLSDFISLNAVYFSAYLMLAMFIVWMYRKHMSTWIFAVYVLLFLSGILLLASKMLLLVALLSSLAAIWQLFGEGKRWRSAVFVLLSGGVVLFVVAGKFSINRFVTEKQAVFSVVQQDTFYYNTPFTGTTLRLVLWKHSIEVLQNEHAWLTGVGVGDFQQLLNERYFATGMFMGDSRRGDTGYTGYNPHNQYVEVLLATGFAGLVILLCWLISLLAVSGGHLLNKQLFWLVVIVMFTECFLSANKGIIWFLYWMYLLVQFQDKDIN